MELRHKVFEAAVTKAGESNVPPNVVVAMLSETVEDRVGDVVVAAGCRMDELKNGVTSLWQHDADHPIARCAPIWRSGERIMGKFTFPPPGTSEKSDEALRLIKAGVVDSVSIGFQPHQGEPLRNGRGGMRFTDWSLLEVSFVSVPALPSAVVTAKRGPQSGSSFMEHARATLARLKSDPDYRAYLRQQEAERLALRRAADRAEIDELCQQARENYIRRAGRWR